jgi:hypothetical protein
MVQVTRRQAIVGGLSSLFVLALANGRGVVAQSVEPTTDTPLPATLPTFMMFHVEAGW